MKTLLSVIFIIVCAGLLPAQTVRRAFSEIPDSLLPLLTKTNRLDCLDFRESGMKAIVENRLDEKSEMTALTDSFLSIATTARTSWELRLLPQAEAAPVLCVVKTFRTEDVAESEVCFYTADWKALPPETFLTLPTFSHFLPAGADTLSGASAEDFYHRMRPLFLEAHLSAEVPALTFTLSLAGLTDELKKEVEAFGDWQPCVFRWDTGQARFLVR